MGYTPYTVKTTRAHAVLKKVLGGILSLGSRLPIVLSDAVSILLRIDGKSDALVDESPSRSSASHQSFLAWGDTFVENRIYCNCKTEPT